MKKKKKKTVVQSNNDFCIKIVSTDKSDKKHREM